MTNSSIALLFNEIAQWYFSAIELALVMAFTMASPTIDGLMLGNLPTFVV